MNNVFLKITTSRYLHIENNICNANGLLFCDKVQMPAILAMHFDSGITVTLKFHINNFLYFSRL